MSGAILVSPWLDRRIDTTKHYQNTSILRFVQDLIAPPGLGLEPEGARSGSGPVVAPYLTQRDRYAKSFAHLFTRSSSRTDCPPSIEGYGEQWNWGGAVTGATNASPIVITSNTPPPPTGSQVTISGVTGNTAANNTAANETWTITNSGFGIGPTFSLNGSTGNGAYTGGGIWAWEGESGFGFADDTEPPAPYTVELAKQYADILPGHPDSGKPITREFPTRAALSKYMQERKQAALRHYASARQQPTM